MALATQCPHCHTTFKVAHDQLKLRSGLVRCGACKQIFNGIENLVAPDQASPGIAAAAPEKTPPPPPAAAPEPPTPIPAPVSLSAPPAAPSVVVKTTTQTAPLTPASAERSAIDALDFIPVDDPETRTRILAAEPEPGQMLASESTETDEDPLTRMTLVDFSIFDEDVAKAAASGQIDQVGQATPPARQNDEIWPDTRGETIGAEETVEAAEQAEPEAAARPDAPASLATPQEDAAADPSTAAADASLGDALTNVPADAAAEAKIAGQPEPVAGADENTVAPSAAGSVSIPAALAEASSDIMDAQEYDEADSAVPLAVADEDVEEPAFVISERRRQRRRRVLRVFMAVASVLLLAAALGQAAYVFRSQLAARFPQTKPILSRLCDLAGCQVPLPAQIEQVSIESNELQAQAANKNVFTLSLLLHNRGTVIQAWPHIELTLNDKDGKALVRRVLTPREYLPSDKHPAEGIAARSEQAVKVSFELNQLEASDYRVYLFYP